MTLPTQNKATEPRTDCFTPDASGPACMVCWYPRYIPNPVIDHPRIDCVCYLFLDLECLKNEHCNGCRREWPGFVT
jgi:hypothetical protein